MIKDFIGNVFGFNDKIYGLNENVKNLNAKLKNRDLEIDNLNDDLDIIEEENEKLEDRVIELENKYEKEIIEDNRKEYWNNKYKRAIIEYSGRTLPNSTTRCKVPVNVLITPNDGNIIQDLQNWGLYRTGEDPETLIPKIYHKIKEVYYKYEVDKNVWGNVEIWEFPFEMRELAKHKENKWAYDCDSYASLLVSYYICAGVPRWKVRVVAGNCWLGGHSTVYCYSEIDNKWHHLNSTYGFFSYYDKVSEYPTHDDAASPENPKGKDRVGIYNVWLSYNDLYCWYDFKGDIPKELQLR